MLVHVSKSSSNLTGHLLQLQQFSIPVQPFMLSSVASQIPLHSKPQIRHLYTQIDSTAALLQETFTRTEITNLGCSRVETARSIHCEICMCFSQSWPLRGSNLSLYSYFYCCTGTRTK